MTTLSKLVDKSVNAYTDLGFSKLRLSQTIVLASVGAYIVHFTYPTIRDRCTAALQHSTTAIAPLNKKHPHRLNNNVIGATGDDGATGGGDTVVGQQIAQAEQLLAETAARRQHRSTAAIGLNKKFVTQMRQLMGIMIPGLCSREVQLLAVHTLCLVSRTFLSIYVAAMEGALVKYIVRKDVRSFLMMLLQWFGIAIPATFINSMIRYLENRLALQFRTRLVQHSYRLYFKNQTYYRVANLDGRIENADHRLTEDIATFATTVAHLYGSITKPCFDLLIIGYALMRSSQKMRANVFAGPTLALAVIGVTGHIMRIVSPKFGQLVAEEANRYGYLRHIHSRIITNAEEIAFYGGHRVELLQLREAYARLTQQMNAIYTQKLWFVMLEQFFMKYVWSGTGMVMVSLPILTTSARSDTDDTGGISERTQYLTTARNLLGSAADAIERLMSSYKDVVSLAGYTDRVAGMLDVFDDSAQGIYHKQTVVSAAGAAASPTTPNTAGLLQFVDGRPLAKGRIVRTGGSTISLLDVPVVTPNCDIVVASLTLSIEPGMHLLITGPNGCGKSSLFRILSGLWPIYGGELRMPVQALGRPCMFYIPQRPYLSIGSLRDQIIYPDTVAEMVKRGQTEADLIAIMRTVSLEHIVARDSFEVVRDWKDILSGGEKQRMAIARLFYHKPQYALLDECTSAVSIDVESTIYEAAKAAGITLLTITHRPTLWRFHTHILEFDGQGNWNFQPLATHRSSMSSSAAATDAANLSVVER